MHERHNDLPWILGLGILVALIVGLMQTQPLFGVVLALCCAVMAIPVLTRSTTLLWLILPLVWFHHSSTGMIYSWLFFMSLLMIELLLTPTERQNQLREHGWLLFMAGSALVLVVALNGGRMVVIGQWIWDFGILLLYVVLTRLEHRTEAIRMFVIWLLLVMGLAGLGVVAEGFLNPGIRARGFVAKMPTGAAYNLAMFVPLALGAIRGTRLGKVAGVVAAILFAAIFYTGSRAPFAAVILTSLPFLMQYRLPLLAAGSALVAGIMLGGGGLVTRVEGFQKGNVLVEASTIMRLVMWVFAIDIISAHPWTGVGVGVFRTIVERRLPFEDMLLSHPHNVLLNKMVQLGIPLALLFFAIITGILIRNFRLYRRLKNLSTEDSSLTLGFMLAPWPMLICGMTDSIFNGYEQPFLVWTMLALQTIWLGLMTTQYSEKVAERAR
ncbi:MAG: O-antigen ligase family protein [Candidatus Delongbacteria bacterium]|nr:O-antigen ligase family protein [Candidatus Cloacimonadota bacterium]MCA9786646.1 O-antigen ligase family protein [Candidatus Cloacimonadota bacterium]MCB9473823.1 O-antigen ligase family protein [Candidatus Delongbacteria bacterium]